jgi:hypothetical protein
LRHYIEGKMVRPNQPDQGLMRRQGGAGSPYETRVESDWSKALEAEV